MNVKRMIDHSEADRGSRCKVDPIRRGQKIDVTIASDQELGIISPFGVRSGQDAGTFTLPVPADAIRNGRLFVPLSITQFGAPPHTPTAEEVRSVRETDRPRRAALSAGRRFTFLGAVNRRV